jgi:hypothetical protein
MAIVNMIAGLEGLHGKMGDVCFRTLKNGTVFMCKLPRKRVRRKASKAQKAQRERFSVVVKKVNEVMQDANQRSLMEVLYKQYGQRNETLRGFVFRQVNKMLAK